MSDLIDKLNVLVRARINSALSGGEGRHSAPRTRVNDVDDDDDSQRQMAARDPAAAAREIGDLRKAIDQALDTEEGMQKKLDALRQQAADLDQRADDALLAGNDSVARDAVQQLKMAERSAASLESDLRLHRQATSQLIEQVNHLEAILADQEAARQRQAERSTPQVADDPVRDASASESAAGPATRIRVGSAASPASDAPSPTPAGAPGADDKSAAGPVPIAVRVGPQAGPPPGTARPAESDPAVPPTPQEQIRAEVERAQVEDDLARRRARLSGPDTPHAP